LADGENELYNVAGSAAYW